MKVTVYGYKLYLDFVLVFKRAHLQHGSVTYVTSTSAAITNNLVLLCTGANQQTM